MPRVRVETGPEISYEQEGDGIPLILGHGFMLDRTMFTPMVEKLRDHCRVIAWDARGHGDTKYDGRPFTEENNAQDLIALMDALSIERAVIGGHSQGGFVAMLAALQHPERVSGLVLINTTPHNQAETSFAELEQFITEWNRTGPTPKLCQTIGAMVFGASNLTPWIAKWMAQPKDALSNPFRAVVEREDLSARVTQIKVPALVVHSTGDAGIPLREAQELAARLVGADPVFVVEGAPHASCCTHPELVAARIIRFMATLQAETAVRE